MPARLTQPRFGTLGFALASMLVTSVAAGLIVAAQSKPAVNADRSGAAVKGYDVVAYTANAAVKGSPAFEHRWNGAVFRFSSAANRDRFAQAPEQFAPQFGGYCAYAVSRGYPQAFRIVDGRLYLNYSKRVQRLWEEDVPGNIAKGQANWPGVLNK
jgi:YHS domain-containing protein